MSQLGPRVILTLKPSSNIASDSIFANMKQILSIGDEKMKVQIYLDGISSATSQTEIKGLL